MSAKTSSVLQSLLLIGLTGLSIHGSPAEADEAYDFVEEGFTYTRCHAVSDPLPGPAAAFGQDVCVDYEVMVSEAVSIISRTDGTADADWQASQRGAATIRAQGDDAVLATGFIQSEEVAEDLGNDASCLSSGDGTTHASVATCILGRLDRFMYFWEFSGDALYSLEATGSAEGDWCALDSRGQEFGPGCF